MKFVTPRRPSRLARLGALLALCAAALTPTHAAERGPTRRAPVADMAESEARVIVKFKADSQLMRALSFNGTASTGPQHAQALASRLGLALKDGRPMGARMQVMKGSDLSSSQLAERLASQNDVEYAVVDARKFAYAATPNDPLFPAQTGTVTPAVGQWYLQPPSSTAVAAINALGAWSVTLGVNTVVVADLDTGVRFDHPDLVTKLLPGYDFIGGDGSAKSIATANDNDARDADASDPGDWITQAEANAVGGNFYHCGQQDQNRNYVGENSSWHGTQTAGLIGAATDNGIGMASVGRNVMVQPLRVIGKCGGYDSDIIDAIRYAANVPVTGLGANPTPARVINMSFGGDMVCSQAYQDAVNDAIAKGVVLVAATGNEGLPVGSPANCTGVIAVGGVRHTGTKVGYSNLGPEVAISAPAGNCINDAPATCLYPVLTTSNSGATMPVAGAVGAIYTDGGNDASLGTSFSTPMVAGTVALMLSINPSMTPSQVVAALKSTARPFPTTGAPPSQHVSGGPLVAASACTNPGVWIAATPGTATAPAQGYECYCTTATCGAGLLDAGAAVAAAAAAAPVTAVIAPPASVAAGTSVTLDGSGSHSGAGAVSYQWAITAGATLAGFTSATNASTVTLATTAAGSVTVAITVTDGRGQTATVSTVLTVTAPIVIAPTPAPATSSGGGGAMSPAWMLAWLAAVVAVRWVTPRRRA